MKNLVKLYSIVIIFCLGILVYSDSFFCSFHFDDEPFIILNPAIRKMGDLQNIWHYFHGRFVTFLTLAFNYHFNGLNVFGYHLFNLAVHIASAILVWWLTLLTLSTPVMKEDKITQHANLIALFAGLIFVSHPVQIEGVTYIWQRAASMVAMFYLASICFYVKSRSLPLNAPNSGLARSYYMGSLITAVLAMFTKENAVTLPLMILFYEFTFLKTKKSLDWKYVSPFLLTLLIIPITFLFIKSQTFQDMHGDLKRLDPGGAITPMHYFLTQFRVMITYMRLVFVPVHQNIDYDYPVFKNIFEWPVLVSFLCLMAIFYGAKRLFSRYRLISFSIFWFFLTLTIPESSFWAMGDLISEHRLYLPMVGYSMFLASSVYYLFGKNNIKTMAIILSLIIACYGVLTYQRNKVWENDFTLWDDAVQKSPHKARSYNGRGIAYFKQGDLDQAMADFNKGIAVNPRFPDTYINLGIIDEIHGKHTEALIEYTKAIVISPNFPQAYYNRGLIYDKLGLFSKAIADFTEVIEINPRFKEAYNKRGFVYFKEDQWAQAMSDYNKAIEIEPNFAEAYTSRGVLYIKQGNFAQAISDFNKSVEINPRDGEAYMDLGVTYGKQGNLIQAISEFNKAIEINPNNKGAYQDRAFANSLLKGTP